MIGFEESYSRKWLNLTAASDGWAGMTWDDLGAWAWDAPAPGNRKWEDHFVAAMGKLPEGPVGWASTLLKDRWWD